MGSVNFTCCSTVDEKPSEQNNETTSEQTPPIVYTYPALSQNHLFPRSLSDTTIRIHPAN